MRLLAVVSLLIATLWVACAPRASGLLHVENRGGPDLVFMINGAFPVGVPCDGGAEITTNQAGIPLLPWHLEVRRARDAAIVLTEDVSELPRWFVQIGDETLGLSASPIEGPPGPPCR
ncbi:MAG TPA: hypothetical protein VFV72_13440 [Candidatus Limnocylindrales bacterium]|nr:hypothetical protein [Candidatus Limnocylindrales bacterium]